MAKNIILFNLKPGITNENYEKWCEEYQAPFLLSLSASRSHTLIRISGGIKGNGEKSSLQEGITPPFAYIAILDVTSLEEWEKDTDTREFQENFLEHWLSTWVADFYILDGEHTFVKRSCDRIKNFPGLNFQECAVIAEDSISFRQQK